MTATFSSLCELDDQLVRAGHYPLTAWWKRKLEHFYLHPTAKTLVAQVGRGGAKSSTAVRVALNEALFGDFEIPAGEIHYAIFCSATKEEAHMRLLLIKEFLTALGIPHDVAGDTITLTGLRRGFRCVAPQVALSSGYRSYFGSADECTKYRSASGSNPASEVVATINAMSITHKSARMLLVSSPWSTDTYHYRRVLMGDTAAQLVVMAPSWVANDCAITELGSKLKEPDEAVWRREYAAIASMTLQEGFFPEDVIQRCIDVGRSANGAAVYGSRYWVACDPAFSAKGDLFGVAVVTSEHGDLDPLYQTRGPRITRAVHVDGWRATGEATPMIQRLKKEILGRFETGRVYSDSFEGFSFRDLAKAHGVTVEVIRSQGAENSTVAKFKAVRTAMTDAAFRIPDCPHLINELRAVASELSASGNELIRLPKLDDGSHCDRVSSLCLAGAMALAKPAHLPEARMSRIEIMERRNNERLLRLAFCG